MTANKANIPIRINIKKNVEFPTKNFDTSNSKSILNNSTSSIATDPTKISIINCRKIEKVFEMNDETKMDISAIKKPIKRIQNLSPIKPSFVK
jgi:hypothetical protein